MRAILKDAAHVALLATILGLEVRKVEAQAPTPGSVPSSTTTQPRDARPADVGTARIAGIVVSADSSTPVRRALVQLTAPRPANAQPFDSTPATLVATDAEGRFEFRDVPAGRHTFSVSKAGYVTASRPVDVSQGQVVSDANFELVRGGVIFVRVVDDRGDPVEGIVVNPLRRSFVNGQQTFAQMGSRAAVTDEAGERRLDGLAAGEYYIRATGRLAPIDAIGPADSTRVFAPTYFPGTALEAEAQPVSVVAGQETTAVITLVATRPARIAGVVRAVDGSVPHKLTVSLAFRTAASSGGRNLFPQPDGTFSMPNVLPGEYTIEVSGTVNGLEQYASVPIRVHGDDITGLVVTPGIGSRIKGTFVLEGTTPSGVRPEDTTVYLRTNPGVVGSMGRSTTQRDWTFEITGLRGSGVLGVSRPPAGWFLKAVRLNGEDVTDRPIDFGVEQEIAGVQVILSNKPSVLTGDVLSASGDAAANRYVVVLFPEDASRWTPNGRFMASARPDPQGRFRIQNMPAGRYLVVAVASIEPGREQDPAMLAVWRDRATGLTLLEGETQTIRLRLVP